MPKTFRKKMKVSMFILTHTEIIQRQKKEIAKLKSLKKPKAKKKISGKKADLKEKYQKDLERKLEEKDKKYKTVLEDIKAEYTK